MIVGALEAKNQFSSLLEQVSRGVEITITENEKPVARLIPCAPLSRAGLRELFRDMEEFGARHPLNAEGLPKLTYRDLIEEGRR